MAAYLLSLLLFLQTNPTGTVTGIVRNAAGMPAAGVRVYAISTAEPKAAGTPALEGLNQTDGAGRFRLEVPAGQYVIAAGSVASLTYAPGTPDLTRARVVSITSTALVDNVDISGYVTATSAQANPFMGPPIPGATGVLSGVIRYSDGTPAVGLYVIAAPASILNGGPAGMQDALKAAANLSLSRTPLGRTDSNGRYRLDNLAPDSYYVMAGFANSFALYPGVTDIASASTIATTPNTNLDSLNFTIPPRPKGTTVSGRMFTAGGMPAEGASVQLRLNFLGRVPALLLVGPSPQTTSKSDGSFEIQGVAPGTYVVEARMSDASPIARNIVVADQPIADLQFSFPVTAVRGRILWEDGTPFSDAQSIGEVGLVTGTSPNVTMTTLFPLDASGTFRRTMAQGDYRLFLRTLPDDYSIRSITFGGVDLLKETLKVTAVAPVDDIEVRLGKRMTTSGTRIRGKVLDAVTGQPAVAETLMLCCQENGPIYRIATRVREDGSFEFFGVTPGVYTAQLRSRITPELADHKIAVGDADVNDITLLAATELVAVATRVVLENGTPVAASDVTITFSGTSERTQIAAGVSGNPDQTIAWVPPGDRYRISVTSIPDGYVVKAIEGGDGTLLTGGRLAVAKGSIPSLTITIGRK